MKTINWNDMSKLGLIRRINEEILHPLGLAMSRNIETGTSEEIFVADDGIWEYAIPPDVILSDDEIKRIINEEI